MPNDIMMSRIRELRESSIEDAIKAEMTARETEQMVAGEYKVRWTTAKSDRLDNKRLKAGHADLYKLYSKETVTRRFSIA